MNLFTVHGKLPGLNELIAKNRLSKYAGAELKRKTEQQIIKDIRDALANGTLVPVNGECSISFIWHENTKRRDLDNIYSAKKFILDAMVKEKIIPNDSQRYVVSITDSIIHSKTFCGVRVYIKSLDDIA